MRPSGLPLLKSGPFVTGNRNRFGKPRGVVLAGDRETPRVMRGAEIRTVLCTEAAANPEAEQQVLGVEQEFAIDAVKLCDDVVSLSRSAREMSVTAEAAVKTSRR